MKGDNKMFLQDYIDAVNYMMKVLGKKAYMVTFTNIAPSIWGDTWIFTTNDPDESYYKLYTLSGVVVKEYKDTWRNPKHREIISSGK